MSGLISGSGSSMYPEKSMNKGCLVSSDTRKFTFKLTVTAHTQDVHAVHRAVCVLTDETVHVLRVAGVVWDSETSITDSHLALPKRKSEVAQFIEQTTHGLYRQAYQHTSCKCESAYSMSLLTIYLIIMVNQSHSHPNVCLCRDDLSTIEVDHLWSTVGQSSVPGLKSRVISFWILIREKTKSVKSSENSLFDFLLNDWHPLCLRVLEAISGTSKITEHVVSPVVQKNIFHLCEEDKMRRVRTGSIYEVNNNVMSHNKLFQNN